TDMALLLAQEKIPEATETTTRAASHAGRICMTSQSIASSRLGRFGLREKAYMPVMLTTTENATTINPATTMDHRAPPWVRALYMLNLRPGSASTLKASA